MGFCMRKEAYTRERRRYMPYLRPFIGAVDRHKRQERIPLNDASNSEARTASSSVPPSERRMAHRILAAGVAILLAVAATCFVIKLVSSVLDPQHQSP